MKKRPVLLLELCIAMVLMAGIVAILFSSYRELSIAKHHLKKEKELVFNRQRLQLRLTQIFSHLAAFDEDRLFFTYDNGADLEPSFRGAVAGQFYIEKGNLFLATWPEKGAPRVELLFEGAETFSVKFFDVQTGKWSDNHVKETFMMKAFLNNEKIPIFL